MTSSASTGSTDPGVHPGFAKNRCSVAPAGPRSSFLLRDPGRRSPFREAVNIQGDRRRSRPAPRVRTSRNAGCTREGSAQRRAPSMAYGREGRSPPANRQCERLPQWRRPARTRAALAQGRCNFRYYVKGTGRYSIPLGGKVAPEGRPGQPSRLPRPASPARALRLLPKALTPVLRARRRDSLFAPSSSRVCGKSITGTLAQELRMQGGRRGG